MFIDRGDKLDAYPFSVPGSRRTPRPLTQDEKRKFADEWLKKQREKEPKRDV